MVFPRGYRRDGTLQETGSIGRTASDFRQAIHANMQSGDFCRTMELNNDREIKDLSAGEAVTSTLRTIEIWKRGENTHVLRELRKRDTGEYEVL